MEFGKLYFFTATIKDWIPLFEKREFKQIILDSLGFLTSKSLIRVYAFVIMPNHIHVIWEMVEMNGKESPHASFLKFAGHEFLKKLRKGNPELLENFAVNEANKSYSFWQRDSLPIELFSPMVIYQKLGYIHQNPCRGKWMLADNPLEYPFSSYEFYETGKDRFGFLTHIGERG
jgi:REP element-mobilizing transposase RayT